MLFFRAFRYNNADIFEFSILQCIGQCFVFGERITFREYLFQAIYDNNIIIISFRWKITLFTGKELSALVQNKLWLRKLGICEGNRLTERNKGEGKQLIKQLEHLRRHSLRLYTMAVQIPDGNADFFAIRHQVFNFPLCTVFDLQVRT